jgi:5-deoxy-glucuronate isomerase
MTDLLVKPSKPDAEGRVIHITPETAGWQYVGLDIHRLEDGKTIARNAGRSELVLVLVSGHGRVAAGGKDFGRIGERLSPFEGAPWSVYVPAHSDFSVTAEGNLELAICSAPAEGKLEARVIPPAEASQVTRGVGTNTRYVRNILPESEPAESILVVECVTPGGHWSSYPPHKHDTDNVPAESYLEETYYHRLNPPQGYALQRVYTDDLSLDVTMAAYDGDVVLVPRGYHPVSAPYGFDLYYLNVMAGPKRTWKFYNEPQFEFLVAK